MIKDEFGNRIKILMEKENVSLTSFANEIGITLGGLNHILAGRNKPRYDMLLKIISKYKNISLDWLMLGCLPMYKKGDSILPPTAKLTSFDTSSLENTNKPKKPPIESFKIQSFVGEFSMSEAIEEIRIFFKNKTYLVLKPEK